jgi:hypothetical protein
LILIKSNANIDELLDFYEDISLKNKIFELEEKIDLLKQNKLYNIFLKSKDAIKNGFDYLGQLAKKIELEIVSFTSSTLTTTNITNHTLNSMQTKELINIDDNYFNNTFADNITQAKSSKDKFDMLLSRLYNIKDLKIMQTTISEIKQLALNRYEPAQFQMGLIYYDPKYLHQNYTMALSWFEISALNGKLDAIYFTASMYYYGKGIPKDFNKALHWYEIGAKKDDKDCIFKIALMYYIGDGVPIDTMYAKAYFRRLKKLGDKRADKYLPNG